MTTMPHWPIPNGKKIIDLELSRIKQLLNKLGNPEKKMAPIVHVAGTNGKGSTIAYLKAILENAGYKVHRYTSPHLLRFNERITIAGEEINDDFLYQINEECRVASKNLDVTFFEGTTAAAFLAFSKISADIVLLETGMGGRLDATNVIDDHMLSVITPISLDHMEYLGDSLVKIAREKSGIIKPNRTCIISKQTTEVYNVLKDKCEDLNSNYFAWGEHWNCSATSEGFRFVSDAEFNFPKPSLTGIHQITNAATAVAALQYMKNYNINQYHIAGGIISATWPARMENITKGVLYKLLPPGSELWLDGAHNIGGAEVLVESLYMLPNLSKPLYLINGRTKPRDVRSFLIPFLNKVKMLCAVEIHSAEALSEKPENIVQVGLELGFKSIISYSLQEAITSCLKDAECPCRILICGSLYLAADFMQANKE